ncbi:MAG: SGNH/GDSL hydrolase family protein [Acidobacteriota bacterium]
MVGRVLARLFTITLPTLALSLLVLAAGVEAWVRLSWDPTRGSPGLFVADAVRGQRLAPNYDGWFAGVPTRINNLGFRDDRDFSLAKGPATFRILVLGDSVTFGHGSVHTYPRLLEDALRLWRPEVDWQVWNLGVPGYNTSQELAHLLDVGPQFQPDLVVVGFFENDLTGNVTLPTPGALARLASRAVSRVQQHLYSFEFYKRVGLQVGWLLSRQDSYRLRLQHLATESALLANAGDAHGLPAQALTPYDRLSDEEIARLACPDGERPDPTLLADMERQPGWVHWVNAVRGFQDLQRQGRYRIVFFLNIVPPICPDGDFFYEGTTRLMNDFLMRILADGTPAVSSLDAFLRRRPSQMPAARAHAIGNANMTKAEVLFDYVREAVKRPASP